MGGRLATSFAVVAGLTLLSPRAAHAGEDDLVLDLGSASDKPTDAGTPLRKLELRRIPKGTFTQGSSPNDPYREPDEVPRTVTISHTFWMGKYPITRAQFARFVAETRHQTDAEKGQSGGAGWDGVRLKQDKQYNWRNPGFVQRDDDPVTVVTFGDANAFTQWASRKTGRRVRLPTEAEFEYAARGGTTTPWYAAKTEEEAAAIGWFRPAPGAAVGTHPVGRKKPNPFGLYDMAGNVNQWCRDVYAVWPATDVTDPENTTHTGNDPERRVLRGGSWMRDPRRGRSAARVRNTPGTRNADNGFRVVVEDAPVIAPTPGATATNDVTPAASASPGAFDAGFAIAPPPPVLRQSTGGEGFSWAFVAAPAGAAGFVVAWMLARRKSGGHTNAQGITTRASTDGFWVRAPNLPPGARVRYTCIVKGREVSDVVPLDGVKETFVFTGDAPSMIRITEAASTPAQISYRQITPPAPASSSSVVPPASSPSMGQRSPWPSERGSSRSVGIVAAASTRQSAAPPVAPSGVPPALSTRQSAAPPVAPSGVAPAVLSGVPSTVPSGVAPAVPSGVPPAVPSGVPPAVPSAVPPAAPPAAPSGVPSTVPSGVPPAVPSAVPSGVPPAVPSAVPSGVPPAVPPAAPSGVAPAVPSGVPSAPSSEPFVGYPGAYR
ncbi:MAG: SUMF1/EgtB/PvdO family nonheme iron enzyme [Labilithrix sp.]|nr:SUMF1/EgtB/PvdO family nonheme iron enzyme [Labilithrix sp.]MCW5811174.1 SUMF1/EgtB/PvdO family nonheme iron enzyme [Labilithrix sp.]